MIQHRFQLDKSSRKFACPSCAAKRFVRYVDTETGNYFDEESVGRCDRLDNCAYHLTPREVFQQNVAFAYSPRPKNVRRPNASNFVARVETYDYHQPQHLIERLANYDRNPLTRFLFGLFPDNAEAVESVIADYWIGTYLDPYGDFALLPYLDERMRFCRGKLIRFNSETGKRLHGDHDTSTLRAKLRIAESFRYDKRVFFGEHLLSKHPNRPIAVVESEKSALIGTLCSSFFPDMTWIASGGKGMINAEKLKRVAKGRKMILFSDAGAYESWQIVSGEATKLGVAVSVSNVVEIGATEAEKSRGVDIADYLIRERQGTNRGIQEIIRVRAAIEN